MAQIERILFTDLGLLHDFKIDQKCSLEKVGIVIADHEIAVGRDSGKPFEIVILPALVTGHFCQYLCVTESMTDPVEIDLFECDRAGLCQFGEGALQHQDIAIVHDLYSGDSTFLFGLCEKVPLLSRESIECLIASFVLFEREFSGSEYAVLGVPCDRLKHLVAAAIVLFVAKWVGECVPGESLALEVKGADLGPSLKGDQQMPFVVQCQSFTVHLLFECFPLLFGELVCI